ncbi:outer membrane beta-barrel protein [Pedobacter insulae]|uniref:Carboxypeptidase regulatory-like domain-containing protein n=1 Tax=Pedobacter insulae TaxID=414048 RepID=A0A1I2ZGA5_9SPHI|nr:outer membrane beta-barrel protein [Pedobacter insulae]SFH36883.1 Carboxypeptidase regulatory-like domain-containing protein [Pedobacter insulae]
MMNFFKYPAKGLALFSLLLCYTTSVYAQTPQNTPKPSSVPPPVALREISGIVKDTVDFGIPGTTVRLSSEKDTLVTVTNGDGVFVFKNVKSATYTLAISNLGFKSLVAKFKQNDAVARIVMDPIILKEAPANTLNEVVINGTPSITYKTDTVEYRASDYIVRENATVDELLKKMEGMEVGTDGSLVHQGTAVTKAKINGKTYLGGDVSTAIQNLPAEIVDKIQMVDDYGDQAARTGIKDGDPEKILNIVTRADKSVGNTANIRAGGGNNERYEGSVFASRLNKNQTIGVNARLNNTVNGVANSGDNGGGGGGRGGNGGSNSSGGSGGTTNNGNSAFSFRDQIGKKIKINTNYRYNFDNVNTLNNSLTIRPVGNQSLFILNDSKGDNNKKGHNFNLELEADLDSNNYIKFTPSINYTSSLSGSKFSIFQTGSIHQDQIGSNTSINETPNLEATLFYQHLFAKPRRNFSVQLSVNSVNTQSEQDRNSNVVEYLDGTTDVVKKQLLTHRLVERDNLRSTYRGSVTYVEPINLKSQFEINTQVNYNGYDNKTISSDINAGGAPKVIDSLSNIYDYSFLQSRIAVNYRYGINTGSKIKFSLGATAVPALLSGTKVSLGTTTNRSSFNIIPIARFQYLWSRQHSMQINYSGNANEPSFDQIQPVRDVSNPQSPVVGNPDLKVTFNHAINGSYNNYIANAKLNYSVNMNATFVNNAVVRNSVEIIQDGITVYETRYLNMSGVYRVGGNYSINKQLADRKYNLSFKGSVNHNHNVAMSRNIQYTSSVWNMNNRFGPRINPNEWMEVNPNVGYSFIKSSNTLPTSLGSLTKTLSLNIDGKFIAWQSWILGYSASKNFISGINANISANPLVIDSYMQKEMWKRRATLTLQAFDILNQNNFVNRNISDDGTQTDTKTNALSRYFMVRLSMRLQKWTGARGRNNAQPMRRGDGSFLN